ncbi:hypothetical protein ACHAXT_001534 [Thalassiosira profunda]
MDLTAKPSTPWWSLLSCCNPPPSPGASSTGEAEEGDEHVMWTTRDVPTATPKLNVSTGGKVEAAEEQPETPATAYSEESDETSFEVAEVEECNGFIGEVAISTPPKTLSSSYARSASFSDDEDCFIGELTIATPRTALAEKLVPLNDSVEAAAIEFEDGDLNESKMSDPDEGSYWYADLDLGGFDDVEQSQIRATEEGQSTANDYRQMHKSVQVQDQSEKAEIGFYYFMSVMMLRHVFGSWLPETLDPVANIFRGQLTVGDDSERKEFRKTMTLRELQVKDDRCEVVPQLQRDAGGSARDLSAIDE